MDFDGATVVVGFGAAWLGGWFAMRAARYSTASATRQQAYLGVLQAMRATLPAELTEEELYQALFPPERTKAEQANLDSSFAASAAAHQRTMELLLVELELAGSDDVIRAFDRLMKRRNKLNAETLRLAAAHQWDTTGRTDQEELERLEQLPRQSNFISEHVQAYEDFAAACRRDLERTRWRPASYKFAGYGTRSHGSPAPTGK